MVPCLFTPARNSRSFYFGGSMSNNKNKVCSLKQCENIHVFLETWYGIKTKRTRSTKFHHNDMPILLLSRGITPPVSVEYKKSVKRSDRYILVRDDLNNIRAYLNPKPFIKEDIIKDFSYDSPEEMEKRRRKYLNEAGFDYDTVTGEVKLIEAANNEQSIQKVMKIGER